MAYRVVRYQETPNPNALKVFLDHSAGPGIRSYFRAEEASGDPLGAALFAVPGVTNVLINGGWLTVNKADAASWREIKTGVEGVLEATA
jgi:hypothetical protein